MRHLGSVLLALLAAPLALLLAGRGLAGLAEAAQAGRTDYFGIAASGSAVGLAGLLYALLTMARFAPLGPTLAGLGYLAVGIWALQDPAGFLTTARGDLVGLTDAQMSTAAGIAPLLAVPLLVTFAMPRRWRRPARPEPAPAAAPATPVPWSVRLTQTLDDLPRVPGPLAPPRLAPPRPAPPPPPHDPDATPRLGLHGAWDSRHTRG